MKVKKEGKEEHGGEGGKMEGKKEKEEKRCLKGHKTYWKRKFYQQNPEINKKSARRMD